MRELS